jgi:hypothetical protein
MMLYTALMRATGGRRFLIQPFRLQLTPVAGPAAIRVSACGALQN